MSSAPTTPPDPHSLAHRRISGRFNARFATRRPAPTLLVGGAAEPVYLPARGARPATIRYTRDYARSALHELAHWCLATRRERELEDYGLWYLPPPRSPAEQARFYRAEVPVQALEMLLSRACGIDFRFSADNPGADDGPARQAFEARVLARYRWLCRHGPGRRAAAVLSALNPQWRCEAGLREGP